MVCELLSVGTELLLGDIVNTNAQFISQHLAQAGVSVYHQTVVGDNPERLRAALEQALQRSDMIITTGGLGPTYDDITKEICAELMGAQLVQDDGVMADIERYFVSIGREMSYTNRKQAMVPQGAQVLKNSAGTAPGIWMHSGEKQMILLPGPPREMRPIFTQQIMPRLVEMSGECIRSRSVKIYGIGESRVESILREMMQTAKNPTIAPYAKDSEVEIRISAKADSAEIADGMTLPVAQRIAEIFGENAYSVSGQSLEQTLVELLHKKGLRVATAESCTGGLISQLITSVPGASSVFDCGVCSYANEIKSALLGVSEQSLERYGAVSEQVACEMASGVRELSGADIAVSTTGVAGPGGGSDEKPVGLVYIGVSTGEKTFAVRAMFPNRADDSREQIRRRAASEAIYQAILQAQRD